MESEKYINQIESWLAGTLKGQEKADFEQKMQADKAFAQEVKAYQDMQEFMASSPRNQFRSALEDIRNEVSEELPHAASNERSKYNQLAWVGLILIGITLVLAYLFIGQNQKKEEPKELTDIVETLDTNQTTEDTKIIEEKKLPAVPPREEAPKPKSKSKSEQKTKSEKESTKPKDLGPIATNFDPNPLIEAEMSDMVRGTGMSLSLTTPVDKQEIKLVDGKAQFSFEGTIISNRTIAPPSIRLLLFSNKKEDYENWTPVWQTSLDLGAAENTSFPFAIQQSLELPQGLYYYIFEDELEAEYLKIGVWTLVR